MSASEFAFVRGARVGLRGIRRHARTHSRIVAAIAIVSFVLISTLVFAFGGVAPAGTIPSSAAVPAAHAAHAAGIIQASLPGGGGGGGGNSGGNSSCSGSFSGNCIFQDIWNLFSGFFSIVISGLGMAFVEIFNAFAGGISNMFQDWGFGLGAYGVWGPMMVVVSLGVAAFVAYLFLDGIGIEKDLVAGESEV